VHRTNPPYLAALSSNKPSSMFGRLNLKEITIGRIIITREMGGVLKFIAYCREAQNPHLLVTFSDTRAERFYTVTAYLWNFARSSDYREKMTA